MILLVFGLLAGAFLLRIMGMNLAFSILKEILWAMAAFLLFPIFAVGLFLYSK